MSFCLTNCGICVEIEEMSVTKRGVFCNFTMSQGIAIQFVENLQLVTSPRKKLPKNLEAI